MNLSIIAILLMAICPSHSDLLKSELADSFFASLSNTKNPLQNLTSSSIDNLFNEFAQETLVNLANLDDQSNHTEANGNQTNETSKRVRRGTSTGYKQDDDEYDVLNDKVGIYRLNGVYPAGRICSFGEQLLNFNTITFNQQVLSVCLTENRFVIGRVVETNPAGPTNYYNSTVQWTALTEYRGSGFKQIDYFVKDRQIYFVIAKSGVGMPLFRLDPITMKLTILEQQTISSNPSTINIWQPKTWKANQKSSSHLKTGRTWNLAVANTFTESVDHLYDDEIRRRKRDAEENQSTNDASPPDAVSTQEKPSNLTKKSIRLGDSTASRSKSFKSTLSLFYFDTDSNYFDEYDRIQTFLVKDICTFTINNYDYLVVVNHKAGIQQHQVDSEIFKLDLHEGKWKSIQKIRTYGAVACEFFKFKTQDHPSEDEYFLVLANNHDLDERGRVIRQVNSVIYKFYYDQFIPFQCLHTIGASDVKFVKLHSPDNLELNNNFELITESDDYRSEKSVLAVSTLTGVELYQYNGWKFVLSSVQYPLYSMGPSGDVVYSADPNKLIDNYLRTSNKLFTFAVREDTYLIASNQLRLNDWNCFRMLFKHENQLGNWYESNLNWCSRVVNNLQQNPQLFAYLGGELSRTFSINQQKPIHLNKVIFNREVDFKRVSSPVVVDHTNRKNYSDSLIKPLIAFNSQLDRVDTEVRNIGDLIARSLKLNTKQPQFVKARLDFDNLNIVCSNGPRCSFSAIQTSQLNRHNVSNIDNRLVRINRKDFLWGNQFSFDRVVLNNLNVFGRVNGQLLANNLITKSGNHKFTSPTVLNFGPFAKNINVRNLLNRRRFNVNNVLLNNVNQYVPVPIEFRNSVEIVGNLHVNGLVNKFAPMNDLINSIVTKYSNVTIDSEKAFASGLQIDKLIMTETSTFNGFNLVDTYDNLFWLNKDFTISAPINFTNIHVKGNLRVDGLVNGVHLPGSDFVVANQTNVINGFTTFKSPVTVNYLHLNKSLNNVPTIFNQIDLFMKNIPQRVLAPKYFKSNVHLNGNANVQGTVDGVKLSVFAQELESKAKRDYYTGLVTIEGGATFLNNLVVQGLVNGVQLNNLLANALRTDERVIDGFREVIFASVATPNLKAQTINRLSLERDLVLRNKPQVIYGLKRFVNGLYAQNNFNITRLNQYEIGKDNLHSDVLLRDVSQHIIGHKIIKGDLHVDSLVVANLNGLNLNKLFTLKKDGILLGPIQFNQNVRFDSHLTVDSLDQLRSANNYSINELLNNSLRYRQPQAVTGVKAFKTIFVPKQSNLQVDQINDVRLRDFLSSIVYRDVANQVITGRKVFRSEVTIKDAVFKKRWDGVSVNELKDGFVHQNQDRTINGNLTIKGNAHFGKSLTIRSDILNNVYLPKFFETFVPVDKPAYVKGHVQLNEVEFRDDVQVAGRINNLDLNRDVVLKNSGKQQVIYGRKSFDNVYVRNHVELRSGQLNELNLNRFFANAVRRHSNQTVQIRAPVVVHGDMVAKSVNVNNRINSLNLSALKRNILVDYRVNRSTVITGRKHFDTLVLDGPSQIVNNGDFAGINLQLLDQTYMSLSRSQKVYNPIVFNKFVNVNKLKVKGNLDVNQINGVNVNELLSNSLKSTGDQLVNSPIIFKGNVKVDKDVLIVNDQINKIKLNRDLMLHDRPYNVFYNTKRFLNGASIQHLAAVHNNYTSANLVCLNTGKVFDLPRFMNEAVYNDGRAYNVSHLKQFRRVVVDDIVIRSELNGISFNERNLFINSPTAKHVIRGNMMLRGPIYAQSTVDVRRSVNGANLNEFAKDAVFRNRREHVIKGEKLVLGSLEIDNLTVLGSIHGHNITQLARQALRTSVNSTNVRRALIEEDSVLDRIDYCLRS